MTEEKARDATSPALRDAQAPAGPPRPWAVAPAGGNPPATVTGHALFWQEFPPQRLVVDGLLGPGLTILAGKPKGGKSWLALLVAWAVAGDRDLDGRAVWPGDVLYLALEDTPRRLQSRMRKLHADLGWAAPENLTLATGWPRATDHGLYHVAEWLEARKGSARLVIVDVLAKFRKPQKGSGNNYADDYEAVGGLKELVDHYGTSALFVHHTRKLKAEDPFDELSGTYGISGPADTLVMLDSQNATGNLYVRGRDLPEVTIPLTYTPASGRWVLGETVDGVDTAGRLGGKPETRTDQCREWLRGFLKTHAYPAKEIDAAGRAVGHSPTAIRDAKAELGRGGTGELRFQKDGSGQWWVGLGPPADWTRRPEKWQT